MTRRGRQLGLTKGLDPSSSKLFCHFCPPIEKGLGLHCPKCPRWGSGTLWLVCSCDSFCTAPYQSVLLYHSTQALSSQV